RPQLLRRRRQTDAARRPAGVLRTQQRKLPRRRRDEDGGPARGLVVRVERSPVLVAAEPHLRRERGVAPKQARPAPDPPNGFRMTGIALLAVDQDVEESVQFAVLAEQALAVQIARRDVPHSHGRSASDRSCRWLAAASRRTATSTVPAVNRVSVAPRPATEQS